jgi:hypothetical protein
MGFTERLDAMHLYLSRFLERLRRKRAIRRKRDFQRTAKKMQDREERLAGEWFGEPLDLHIVPLAAKRNPRGRDGRRL